MSKAIVLTLSESHSTQIERITAFLFLLGIAVGLVLGSVLIFKSTAQAQLAVGERAAIVLAKGR